MSLDKIDFTGDDSMRIKRRMDNNAKKMAPEILELIQTCPIPEKSYRSIMSFFQKNSLNLFPECDEVLELYLNFINNSNASICCHGVKCIYASLCQKTFQFVPEFASVLCENLYHLVGCPDQTIFYYFLMILNYISIICQDYEQMVKQMITIDILANILLSSDDQNVIFAALNLFRIYLHHKECHTREVYSALCEVSDGLIKKYNDNVNILIETVKLCSYFAKKNICWTTIFKYYDLYDTILSLFAIDSIPLKLNIINLITLSLKHLQRIDNIDFQDGIIPLISHENPDLQNAALACIDRCLSEGYTQKLIDMNLIESSLLCIQNGSFKARLACIPIFDNIIKNYDAAPGVFLDENLLPILLELIPEIHDSSILDTLLRIVKKMVDFVKDLNEKDAFQALMEQLTDANFEDIYEDFKERSKSVDNKSGNVFLSFPMLSEKFDEINHAVLTIEDMLESV